MVGLLVATIAILTSVLLVESSRRANQRFYDAKQLPMQWSFDGTVNALAPRRFVLGFMPALATSVLVAMVVLAWVVPPRSGQEDDVIPAVFFMAAIFVGIHTWHLRMIDRWFNALKK